MDFLFYFVGSLFMRIIATDMYAYLLVLAVKIVSLVNCMIAINPILFSMLLSFNPKLFLQTTHIRKFIASYRVMEVSTVY